MKAAVIIAMLATITRWSRAARARWTSSPRSRMIRGKAYADTIEAADVNVSTTSQHRRDWILANQAASVC